MKLFSGIRRRTYYTDFDVQGRLLGSLVVMEVLVVCAALVYLYFRYGQIIERNLYRIHAVDKHGIVPEFIAEFGYVVIGGGVLHLAALWLAHMIWARYVKAVLANFYVTLRKFRDLDFRAPEQPEEAHHEVLGLLARWRRAERERLHRVKLELRELAAAIHASDRDCDARETKLKLSAHRSQLDPTA